MRTIERAFLVLLLAIAVFDHVRAAHAGPNDRLSAASEFALVNEQGNAVGAFRITQDGTPQLVLSDSKGHGRIILGVRPDDSATIGITDAKGLVRVGLLSQADGKHQVQLVDESASPRVVLTCDASGTAKIAVNAAKDKEVASLAVEEHDAPRFFVGSPDGSVHMSYGNEISGVHGLHLFDKGGAVARIGMDLDSAGTAFLFADDSTGHAIARIEAPADGAPSLALHDKAGKKIPLK